MISFDMDLDLFEVSSSVNKQDNNEQEGKVQSTTESSESSAEEEDDHAIEEQLINHQSLISLPYPILNQHFLSSKAGFTFFTNEEILGNNEANNSNNNDNNATVFTDEIVKIRQNITSVLGSFDYSRLNSAIIERNLCGESESKLLILYLLRALALKVIYNDLDDNTLSVSFSIESAWIEFLHFPLDYKLFCEKLTLKLHESQQKQIINYKPYRIKDAGWLTKYQDILVKYKTIFGHIPSFLYWPDPNSLSFMRKLPSFYSSDLGKSIFILKLELFVVFPYLDGTIFNQILINVQEKITSTDFRFIKEYCTLHHVCPPDNFKVFIVELCRFFILKVLHKDISNTLFYPSQSVEKMWKAIQLFPVFYSSFCHALLGTIPTSNNIENYADVIFDDSNEHYPHVMAFPLVENTRYLATLHEYEVIFKTRPTSSIWPHPKPEDSFFIVMQLKVEFTLPSQEIIIICRKNLEIRSLLIQICMYFKFDMFKVKFFLREDVILPDYSLVSSIFVENDEIIMRRADNGQQNNNIATHTVSCMNFKIHSILDKQESTMIAVKALPYSNVLDILSDYAAKIVKRPLSTFQFTLHGKLLALDRVAVCAILRENDSGDEKERILREKLLKLRAQKILSQKQQPILDINTINTVTTSNCTNIFTNKQHQDDNAKDVVEDVGMRRHQMEVKNNEENAGESSSSVSEYWLGAAGDMLGHPPRYQVVSKLGQGVFGSVYRCNDTFYTPPSSDVQDSLAYDQVSSCCSSVAVKILKKSSLSTSSGKQEDKQQQQQQEQSYDTELSVLNCIQQHFLKYTQHNSISHHIVRLLDSFEYQGYRCIVMENLHCNLRQALKIIGKDDKLELPRLASYTKQTLQALSFLHSLDYIHLDIKPDNIVVDKTFKIVKLIDFGSCLNYKQLQLKFDQKSENNDLVARFYRSPEIILKYDSWNSKIDIWSLGVALLELASGKIVFQGVNNNELLWNIMTIMGPIPEKILNQAKFVHSYFHHNIAGVPSMISTSTRTYDNIKLIKTVDQQECYCDLPMKPKSIRANLLLLLQRNKHINNNSKRSISSDENSDGGVEVQFIDFIMKMLCYDPNRRLDADQLLLEAFIAPSI